MEPRLSRMKIHHGVAMGIPADLLGPTGNVYESPQGLYSTELNVGISDPRLNEGRETNIPLLSRNQGGISHLLGGERVKPKQYELAIRDALARQREGQSVPGYSSVAEARDAELAHHADLEKRLVPYLLKLGGRIPVP